MKISIIKLLSLCILISKNQKNNILTMLFYDYSKTILTKSQVILLQILVKCYEKENIFEDNPMYQFLNHYISHNSTKICKTLLYT